MKILLALFLYAAQEAATPRVFVRVDSGAVEEGDRKRVKELSDSVRDIREQIQKRVDLVNADERAEADVLVTVLDRRIEVSPTGENNYGGELKQTHYQSRYILTYRVETGGQAHESETALAGAFVTWKRVAGTVAKEIGIWARHYQTSEK
ncbi:MAG TPA: hypothetical protein VLK65_21915 [Vicinamibacteria bacterium]|nr:hypothetical protein [Vicinamibacteria bacterium]